MLKGYFDRVLMPGVAFDLTDPQNVKPSLTHISNEFLLWSPMVVPDGRLGTWATRLEKSSPGI